MKRVFLTCGPQHVGKSTFCSKLMEMTKGLTLISRDDMLIEEFGTVMLDSYSGGHQYIWEKLWDRVEKELQHDDTTLILDAWNGGRRERRDIAFKLKKYGADEIVLLYFITPIRYGLHWSFKVKPSEKREGSEWNRRIKRMRLHDYKHFYDKFHSQKIEQEKLFDSVHRIDAHKPIINNLLSQLGLS